MGHAEGKWRIEPFHPSKADDDELRAWYDLEHEVELEVWDDTPPMPYEAWHLDQLDRPSWQRTDVWLAWDPSSRRVLGSVALDVGFTETNRHIASLDISVRAGERRQGLGTALAAATVDTIRAEGRTLLGAGALTGSAGAGFAEALGAEAKSVERKSRTTLADIDRSMLEGWVARAAERAEGYSLVRWDGPTPEEYVERFVPLILVMNTAPRDDLDVQDWSFTPKRLRESEAREVRKGYTWWELVVRHDATDALVGYTELLFEPHDPDSAHQEATAVDPAHRHKGLGRWIKAANCLRLMDERPDVSYISTWNAYSNAPMLAINVAMGFEVIKSYAEYQVTTDVLAERLSARAASRPIR